MGIKLILGEEWILEWLKMAPFTNMPPAVQIVAQNLVDAITMGDFDPFGGKFTDGELLGMSDYLPGIDAPKPN